MASSATTGKSERDEKELSFQERVREDLTGIPAGAGPKVCALGALLACIAVTGEGGLEKGLILRGDNVRAYKKCFTLLEKTANISAGLDFREGKIPKNTDIRELIGRQEYESLLRLLDLMDAGGKVSPWDGKVPWSLIADENCFRAYLSSMVLGLGNISDPGREYRLTFYARSAAQLEQLEKLLADHGVSLKRGAGNRLYTRDSEQIADLLNMSGAHGSLLAMESMRVVRQVRGSVNRKVNCETANIRKTVQAARKQLTDIELLKDTGVLKTLPEALQEIAYARLSYPELSLEELGKRMDPPVGKSGVNHRMRRLQEEAQALREAE